MVMKEKDQDHVVLEDIERQQGEGSKYQCIREKSRGKRVFNVKEGIIHSIIISWRQIHPIRATFSREHSEREEKRNYLLKIKEDNDNSLVGITDMNMVSLGEEQYL